MKLDIQKIKDAERWVEVNGLYPQRCGASVKQFCEAMGIAYNTYQRWQDNVNFVNALTRAREVFKQNTVQEVANALVKAAKGFDCTKERIEYATQIVREYDPTTGKKIREYQGDEIVPIRSYKETFYYPPDVNAAKFLLTNLDPDSWKNKQDNVTDLNVDLEEAPVIVFRDISTQDD